MTAATRTQKWTRDEVVRRLRELSPDGVYAPAADSRSRLYKAAQWHYGSWDKAVAAAGLAPARARGGRICDNRRKRGRESEYWSRLWERGLPCAPPEVVAQRMLELKANPHLRTRLRVFAMAIARYGDLPGGGVNPFRRAEEVACVGDPQG